MFKALKILGSKAKIATLATALVLPSTVGHAADDTWPKRAITLVVPYAPGAGTDIFARIVASKMTEALKQPVVIENREGAGGQLGTGIVARAKPDGYTLLFMITGQVIIPLSSTPPYNILNDFVPIGQVGISPTLLVVNSGSDYTSMETFIEKAKAAPGKLSYGSAGVNSFAHRGSEIVADAVGIELKHVPYRGTAPALVDLLGGKIDTSLVSYASSRGMLESQGLRAIAVTGDKRLDVLPDVPALAELGYPEGRVDLWWGIVAPAKTPPDVVEKLNKALHYSLNDNGVQAALAKEAAVPTFGTPEEFGDIIASDFKRWSEVMGQ